MSKLDGKINEIIDLLIDGVNYTEIANKFDVALSTLHKYITNSENSARVREARKISAATFDDKAEEILKDITLDFQRARELAHHYRWRAGKRSPKEFGDKLDMTTDGEKINNPLAGLTYEQLKELRSPNKLGAGQADGEA